MNKVIWAVQTNLVADHTAEAVWNAAKALGCQVIEAVAIPFSLEFGNESEYENLPDDVVIIPYGSVKLARMSKERNWKGNCYDNERFDAIRWNAERDDMLNGDCIHLTVKELNHYFRDCADEKKWFIRPVKDLKAFNGTVADTADIRNWMQSPRSGSFEFGEDTQVIVAAVKQIYCESRWFIVDGKVVDGSLYRFGGRLMQEHINDPKSYEHAQVLADNWLPHPCCVMDVADTDDGMKVIEFNTINSSGFYDHDIPKIVKAMTEWARNV
ncbi:ATP-grasp domain-containing protein [Xanthomonas phage BUDD]|nr:ATP-grasp domain-containing protein [Xanthomonas phage BUDD]